MNSLARSLAALAVVLIPAVAFAQVPQQVIVDNPITYGAGGGVSVPLGDAEDALNRGFAAQGFARFRLTDSHFAPRLDLAYQQFGLNSDFVGTGGTASVVSGTVNLHLFLSGGTIRPYLIGGIGAFWVKFETDATPLLPASSESSTRFGLTGGGGLSFRINPRTSIYGEIRLDNILNDEGPVDSDLQMVPFTFGITF
jgi:opacity protein-like surface antigen